MVLCLECLDGHVKARSTDAGDDVEPGARSVEMLGHVACVCGDDHTLPLDVVLKTSAETFKEFLAARDRCLEQRTRAAVRLEEEDRARQHGDRGLQREVDDHAQAIVDRVLTLRCPGPLRCPYNEFEGCFAITCRCGTFFCAWCNHVSKTASALHVHVANCASNPSTKNETDLTRRLYASKETFAECTSTRVRDSLRRYLTEAIPEGDVRHHVARKILPHLDPTHVGPELKQLLAEAGPPLRPVRPRLDWERDACEVDVPRVFDAHVDPRQSLAEAVASLPPGASLCLAEGVYRLASPIRIVRSAHLFAVGPVTIEALEGAFTINAGVDSCTLHGLKIRQAAHTEGDGQFAVDVLGRVQLQRCDVESRSRSCVQVRGPEAYAILLRCDIHHSVKSGVVVTDGATAEAHECRLTACAMSGFHVGGATLTARECVVANNRSHGILALGASVTRLSACLIERNGHYQHAGVQSDSILEMRTCRVRRHRGVGVRLSSGNAPTTGDLVDRDGNAFDDNEMGSVTHTPFPHTLVFYQYMSLLQPAWMYLLIDRSRGATRADKQESIRVDKIATVLEIGDGEPPPGTRERLEKEIDEGLHFAHRSIA